MVVEVGLTVVEPLAFVDVKLPGVIAIVVAPEVTQLRVLLDPDPILAGFAVKEVIVGTAAAVTVTDAVDVTDPAAFVAVKT